MVERSPQLSDFFMSRFSAEVPDVEFMLGLGDSAQRLLIVRPGVRLDARQDCPIHIRPLVKPVANRHHGHSLS